MQIILCAHPWSVAWLSCPRNIVDTHTHTMPFACVTPYHFLRSFFFFHFYSFAIGSCAAHHILLIAHRSYPCDMLVNINYFLTNSHKPIQQITRFSLTHTQAVSESQTRRYTDRENRQRK